MTNDHATPSKSSDAAIHLNDECQDVVFLLLRDFTHLPLSSSIEVLRVANLLSDRQLFRWTLIAPEGASQVSSNGLTTHVDQNLVQLRRNSQLFVVSGINAQQETTPTIANYLREQQRHGVQIGALCSGAYILAHAGLLDGKTCAVHWEYYPLFREKFPKVVLSDDAFSSLAPPFTASGGTAGAELMLDLIAKTHGIAFARQIADQLVMAGVRTRGEAQRMPDHIRYGTRNRVLLETLEFMTANIEEPLSTPEIARLIGISVRQIERSFRRYVGCSPGQHYRRLRLDHARNLINTTDLSIIQISLASGFSSASHFSRLYRAKFGITPYQDAIVRKDRHR